MIAGRRAIVLCVQGTRKVDSVLTICNAFKQKIVVFLRGSLCFLGS